MIIIIVGGGMSLASFLLGLFLIAPMGIMDYFQDKKEWDYIQAEAEALLLPADSFYDSIWHNSRGMHYFHGRDYPKAIGAWRKSFECYPNPGALNLIAATYYYQGDLDTAIDYWTVAAEEYPDNDLLKQNLANAVRAREQNPSWKPTLRMAQRE